MTHTTENDAPAPLAYDPANPGFYTCPTACVDTNHPGREHEEWLANGRHVCCSHGDPHHACCYPGHGTGANHPPRDLPPASSAPTPEDA